MSVTVGATLLTVTAFEYSPTPPSLSLIRPLTVLVPLSVVGQSGYCTGVRRPGRSTVAAEAVHEAGLVSAGDGSLGDVSEMLIFEPSSTEFGALKVALGATLLTVTARVASFESPPGSPSLTLIFTVEVAGPSGKRQSNVPPDAVVFREPATYVPLAPQSG